MGVTPASPSLPRFPKGLTPASPSLPGYYPFLANPILPISYQSYPLPAGSQFTRGNTQMGITCVTPIWVTPILGQLSILVLQIVVVQSGLCSV